MRQGKNLGLVAITAVVATLAACGSVGGKSAASSGGSSSTSDASSRTTAGSVPSGSATESTSVPAASATLKVGYVSPQTGPLAPFGEADSFVVAQMRTWFAAHPIIAGGKRISVDIIVKDAQSDSKRAGEVAADLINNDNVDMVLASSTPDITDPVSEQCEANATPCLTTVAPWQPFAIRGSSSKPADLKWSYHFFWGLEDVAGVYSDMWSQVTTDKKAAGLFPNDPDGQAWSANFPTLTKATGVSIKNPGLYADGTQNFAAQISAFKGSDILLGVPIPPDFTTFWKQAKQQGYKPKIATIGKALLFPSSVEALGTIAQDLGTEVWWTPTASFKSSLTGQTAQQLAGAYESATGKQWTQPLGFVHALFEVVSAAVMKAGSTNKTAIINAMKGLSLDTVVGNVTWGKPGLPAYIAKTPLTGGQWRMNPPGSKYKFNLVVVSNTEAKEIPLGGKIEPLP